MKYYQLKDNERDDCGIIAIDESKHASDEKSVRRWFKRFIKETESPDGDPDGFIDWLSTHRKIIAKRIYLTEIYQ